MTAAKEAEAYVVDPNVYSLDPVPLQSREHNRIYPFYDHLREGRLTTTRCSKCDHIAWPPRIICPKCVSDQLRWEDFPDAGRIYAYTVQTGGNPPGFPRSLIFALIDFDNGLRIISQLVDCKPEEVEVGSEVILKVVPASRGRVLFFFRLKDRTAK
jgi:uncharacterized OB-fold protein